jgi:hypothetical protein
MFRASTILSPENREARVPNLMRKLDIAELERAFRG